MSNELDIDDLAQIRREYYISPFVRMKHIPYHFYNGDDPPTRWLVIHFIAFKLGLICLFPKRVARALNTFDIKLAQVNPNGWRSFLCLFVIVGEHRMKLTNQEKRCMYYLKKNGIDKGRMHISNLVGQL